MTYFLVWPVELDQVSRLPVLLWMMEKIKMMRMILLWLKMRMQFKMIWTWWVPMQWKKFAYKPTPKGLFTLVSCAHTLDTWYATMYFFAQFCLARGHFENKKAVDCLQTNRKCVHTETWCPLQCPSTKSAPCLNCGVGTGLRGVLTGLHISAQRVVSLGTVPMGTKCEQNLSLFHAFR